MIQVYNNEIFIWWDNSVNKIREEDKQETIKKERLNKLDFFT